LYKRFYFPDAPDEEVTVDDEASVDSGYVTSTMDGPDSASSGSKSVRPDKPPKYNGTTHSARAPKLSKKKFEQLAEQFAARIPERELSMASLQGYLMSYKTRPFQAVDDIERWVKDMREGQDRRAAADKA
jgi:chaperone BCS1